MLSSSRNSAGDFAMQSIADNWEAVGRELGGTAKLNEREGRPNIIDSFSPGPLDDLHCRQTAITWLRGRVNTFVNVMRPRVRSAVADYSAKAE